MRTILCLTALLIVGAPSLADTVVLEAGGKVEGTVDEIVFLLAGANRKFQRGQFVGVNLSKAAKDTLHLKEGAAKKGELISLQLKSIGGLLTFTRIELKSVTVAATPVSEVGQEYLLKRAQIKDGDGEGLYTLAAWCEKSGLRVEAHDLARRCLDAQPKEETAVLAHRMLGHIFRDWKWIEPGPPKDPKSEPAKPQPEPGKVDRASLVLLRNLVKEYAEKSKEAESKDRETAKSAYLSKLQDSQAKVRKLKKEIDANEKKLDRYRDDIRREQNRSDGGYPSNPRTDEERRRRDRIDRLRRERDRIERALEQQERSHKRTRRDLIRLVRTAQAAMSKVRSRRTARGQRLEIAESKVEGKLFGGSKMTEQEMRGVFDQAMKD